MEELSNAGASVNWYHVFGKLALSKLNVYILYNPAMPSVLMVYSCLTKYHKLSDLKTMSVD